jgi:preprotein translocase subunit SecA
MLEEVLDETVAAYVDEEQYPENWNLAGLSETMRQQFDVEVGWRSEQIEGLTLALIKDELVEKVQAAYRKKEEQLGSDMMRYLERMILLQVVDTQWKDHLLSMDHLKEGIGLRGYGQKDPLLEYKREGFEMFEAMEARIARDTLAFLMKVQVAVEPESAPEGAERAARPLVVPGDGGQRRAPAPAPSQSLRPTATATLSPAARAKVGRNDPCPCGSGKKFKKCCGA